MNTSSNSSSNPDLTPPPAVNDTPLTLNSQAPPQKLDWERSSLDVPMESKEPLIQMPEPAPAEVTSMPLPSNPPQSSTQPDLSNINPVFNPEASASNPVNQPFHQASSMPHLESEQPLRSEYTNNDPQPPNTKRNPIIALVLVLLLAGVSAAGLYYWLNRNSEDDSQQQLTETTAPSTETPQVSPTPLSTPIVSLNNVQSTGSGELVLDLPSTATASAPLVQVATPSPQPTNRPLATPTTIVKEVDLPEAGNATASVALVAGGLMVIFLGLLSLSLL